SQKRLHPIQERLASGNATQCGFCSPGFVMAAYALLRNNPSPSADEIRSALVGNLCRCTGYRPILEALESFAKPSGGCCMGGGGVCPCKQVQNGDSEEVEKSLPLSCGLVNYEEMKKFDESAEIIFPPALIMRNEEERATLHLTGKRINLYCPTLLDDLPDTFKSLLRVDKIVSTGIMTRLIHSMNPSPAANSTWLSTQRIEELRQVEIVEREISIPSGLTIREMVDTVRARCENAQYVQAVDALYSKYSSDQVKNTVGWSGALASAAVSSDLCTLSLALNWRVRLMNFSTSGYRELKVEQFFADSAAGKKTTLADDEIILSLLVPVAPTDRIATFKHGKRFGADDAVLNAAASWNEASGQCR
ncbi:hypothetical protein PFISCL1PPCAC_23176, partial [Pristionchus fissidentatus]